MMRALQLVWVSLMAYVVAGIELVHFKRELAGDYTVLNGLLGQVNLTIDTSTLDPIVSTVDGTRVTVTLYDSASCDGLSVGDLTISGAFQGNEIVGGETFERYDVEVLVQGLTMQCTVALCFSTNHWADFEDECGGTITMIGAPSSNVKLNLGSMVLSKDFQKYPPVLAQSINASCNEKLNLTGVTFTGNNIGRVGGQDQTSAVVNALNGEKKAETIEPIANALCDQLNNLTQFVNDFLVANPFLNSTIYPGVDTDLLGSASREYEDLQKLEGVPSDVDLVNLRDNFLVDLVLSPNENGTVFLSGDLFEFNTGCGDDENEGNDAITNSTNVIYTLLDTLLETNLTATNGVLDRLDVLELLLPVLQGFVEEGGNVTDLLKFQFNVSDFGGAIAVEIENAYLSTTPGTGQDDVYPLQFLGEQTVMMPPLDLGNVFVEIELGLDVAVNTTFSFSNTSIPFAFDLTENGIIVRLDWKGFVVHLAAWLAIDMNNVFDLELGPLVANLFTCIFAAFYKVPVITGFLMDFSEIGLNVDGAQDGILNLLSDLINSLVPIYQGLIPGLLQGLATDNLVNQQVLSPSVCPTTIQSNETMVPFNFSEGVFHQVSELVTTDNAQCLLESFFTFDNETGTVSFLGEGNSFSLISLEIPDFDESTEKRLELLVNDISLGQPSIDELEIFRVMMESPYYPQGLMNKLGIAIPSLAFDLEINLYTDSELDQGNRLILELGVDSIFGLLELFASYTKYFMDSRKLGEILNLDCWAGGLEPYGGVKDLQLDIENLTLSMACVQCDNGLLRELAAKLSSSSVQELVDVLLNVVNEFTGSLVDNFAEDKWAATIETAQRRCIDPNYAPGGEDQPPLPEIENDLTRAYSFVGMFFSTLMLAGICTFGCSFGRKPIPPVNDRDQDKWAMKSKRNSRDEDARRLMTVPLFRHPMIPKIVRFMVPLFIVVNLCLFLLGHIDVVMYTDLVGQILGVEAGLDDFAKLSVIQTVQKLWEGKAYVLALLLFIFSVVWPYIKLLGLFLTWFLPTSVLNFHRRGTMITILDVLGKWSLVELFFLLFFFNVMQIRIQSPEYLNYLPSGLYDVAIVIEPQFNLYTFTTALLLSLLMSNVVVVYHERIEHRVLEMERTLAGLNKSDFTPIGLRDFLFEKQDRQGRIYRVGLNRTGIAFVAFGVLGSIGLILVASMLPVIELKILGLARALKQLSQEETSIEISLFSFIMDSFETITFGQMYFGIVFVLTVLAVPVLQLSMLVVIPLKRFTLPGAIRFLEINQILSAWSCTEVFVLAMAVTCLEITSATSFLVEDVCSSIEPLLFQLYALNLVQANDVGASCLGITADVKTGAYIFFGAMLLSNFVHLFIIKLFQEYIQSRKDSNIHFERQVDLVPADEVGSESPRVGWTVRMLTFFRLLQVETTSKNNQIVPQV